MEIDDITGKIIDASMRMHTQLGSGLLESVYETVLAKSLQQLGMTVERQKPISFSYEGISFEEGFRVDLLVENQVIVELKSVEKLSAVHSKQLLTYLRLMNLPVGLLINFGGATLKEGLQRVVNKLPASASQQLRVNKKGYFYTETRRVPSKTCYHQHALPLHFPALPASPRETILL